MASQVDELLMVSASSPDISAGTMAEGSYRCGPAAVQLLMHARSRWLAGGLAGWLAGWWLAPPPLRRPRSEEILEIIKFHANRTIPSNFIKYPNAIKFHANSWFH